MDADVTQLKKELIQVTTGYPTDNGGGKHGHKDAKYVTFLEARSYY